MSMDEDEPITAEQVAAAQDDDAPAPPEPIDEPDTDDDDTEANEPEPEPEPASPPSDVIMEKRYEKAQTAARNYARRINEIFEEQALDLLPCPLCSAGGTPAFVNVQDAGRVPEPIVDATRVYLGFAREADYRPDPETRECETCSGLGMVRTGSRVPGNESRGCARCHGYGYVPPPAGSANGTEASNVLHFPAGERPDTVGDEDRDISGEPRILPDGRPNPNYGKWPQYKIPVEPYGITAGLTAQDATG